MPKITKKPAKAPAKTAKKKPAKKNPAKTAKPASAKPKAAAKRSPKKTSAARATVRVEDVALRAYYIGERRRNLGIPGDPQSDWLEAERQLLC